MAKARKSRTKEGEKNGNKEGEKAGVRQGAKSDRTSGCGTRIVRKEAVPVRDSGKSEKELGGGGYGCRNVALRSGSRRGEAKRTLTRNDRSRETGDTKGRERGKREGIEDEEWKCSVLDKCLRLTGDARLADRL
jgi:hypothetical protein